MEKFTHGIMVTNPDEPFDDGSIPVVHFVGYWSEPSSEDVLGLIDELHTDKEFGLTEIADTLDYLPATQEVIEYMNLNTHYNEENN